MRKQDLAIIIAVIACSFGSIFIRLSDAEPLAIAFYRLLFTTLLLLPFVIMRSRSELKNLGSKKYWNYGSHRPCSFISLLNVGHVP